MSEIAVRESKVVAVPVPSILAQHGVKLGKDEETGLAVVVIPHEVRQIANVIDPVSSFAQADPNWTPRISVVQLDPDPTNGPHFYTQTGGKLAPTKQALEVLAKAAGILYTRTARIPRDELAEGEALGYKATLGIRRSDGTVEEITRDKSFVVEAELEEIRDAVTRAVVWENGRSTDRPRFGKPGSSAWEAEVRKRWLTEQKNAPAKTESKAVLRAIRAALQIPHTFKPGDAQKPFLVIGYTFTPDYSDEETKRILVAAGLNAQAAFYGGGRTVSRELESGTATPAPRTPPADDAAPDAPHSGGDGRQEAGADEHEPETPDGSASPTAPASPDLGGFDFADEPDADDAPAGQQGFSIPERASDARAVASAAEAAGAELVQGGNYEGQTVAQVGARANPAGWFEYVMTRPDHPNCNAARLYARVHFPELYQRVMAKLETQTTDEAA